MRRVAVVIVLVLAGSVWPVAQAVAGGLTVTEAPAAGALQADFNNDGADDLAVGVRDEDVGGAVDAGAVNVLYGSGAGLTATGSQQFIQVGSAPETDDRFGWALASGDFNNDGFADLAVGAPFENVGSIELAGAVSVLYGSAGGLTTSGGQLSTQPVSAVEEFDLFGRALTAGDFDNDGVADLAAGAPGESVGSVFGAGAVSVVFGSASGLTTSGGQLFHQNSAGVPGAAEEGDFFGFALAVGNTGPATTAAASPSGNTASGARRSASTRR